MADTSKTDRLRAVYDAFQKKMQALRERRLQFMREEFRKLDERRAKELLKDL